MFKYIKGLIMKRELVNKKSEEKLLEELELAYQLQQLEEQEELEATHKKCSCGGLLIPMYEEHPNWIKLCTNCDTTSEDVDFSPIKEVC